MFGYVDALKVKGILSRGGMVFREQGAPCWFSAMSLSSLLGNICILLQVYKSAVGTFPRDMTAQRFFVCVCPRCSYEPEQERPRILCLHSAANGVI